MTRVYHKIWSSALAREMELLSFGHAGTRMIAFPTRKQRFFEYEEHGMIHALRHPIEAGELQVFCVDGLDGESLYDFEKSPPDRITRHLEYERHILDEVIPLSEQINPATPIVTHGCSFGAYHAVSIALRHPARFARAYGFSGRYDLTLNEGDYHTLFYGFYDESLYFIMPSHFIPNLKPSKLLTQMRRLRITLVVGEDDAFHRNNIELANAFTAKKIPHALHVWCGTAHRFRYWRQMARVYWP